TICLDEKAAPIATSGKRREGTKHSRQAVQRALEKDLAIPNTGREVCPICFDHPLKHQHGADIRLRDADGCFVRLASFERTRLAMDHAACFSKKGGPKTARSA
ncbi:MAG: hypothetical protein AB3N21_15940, partial [Ruegeria sp.]|uniref:hypothetical protein n=1 Tax=Ruegeria sp. TaxID=1879320 RepID=UPI00349EA292